MGKSLIFKTALSIIIVLTIITSIIGYINYAKQISLIEHIESNQKNYILAQLERSKHNAIKKELEILKDLSMSATSSYADALYNVDDESTKNILNKFLTKQNIKATRIYDEAVDETFMVAYKQKGEITISNNLPVYFKTLKSLKLNLIVDNTIIGYLEVFYNNEQVDKEIEKLKEKDLKLFYTQHKMAQDEIEHQLNNQIINFILSGFIVVFFIVILLKKFVNNPLIEFQNGLQSFFSYLSDPSIKVKTIKIDSKDEFGQMTKSVNDSIEVSIKLHKDIHDLNTNLEAKINEKTADLKKSKKEIEAVHKHTRESIEYASLIQSAVVSQSSDMQTCFKDHFVIWTPKDTVGGDIWLFNSLRHEDECLLMFIDCTGHGVPGAFLSMIVKAIEREVVGNLKKHPDFDISPAIIMSHFNKTIKKLLKQETEESISNVGLDGGIIYYNKRDQILKFAGAETPLFYIDQNAELKTIKGSRYSIGYKKCDKDYQYKETCIDVTEGMKFYCTTDGYLDQNGGERDYPFGKKRFKKIIEQYHSESMAEQQTIFMQQMKEYESAIANNDRNDDITLIAFEIGKKSDYEECKIEEIVKYEGVMTQNVIAAAMDNIEAKIESLKIISTVSTITIEYCQNMMHHSKNSDAGSRQIVPAGAIEVQYINDEYYDIRATNIISIEDKEKIEPILIKVQSLDQASIKKRYRELRKSGKNSHHKGAGIGIYEIAKISSNIEYCFEPINEDKLYFTMSSLVKL